MKIIKTYYPFFITVLLTLIVFSPVFYLSLDVSDYQAFQTLINYLGKDFSIFSIPIYFYLDIYGSIFAHIIWAHQFFGFNSLAYYSLNLSLRLGSAFSLYLLVLKWSHSRLAAFTASLIFGVSFSGLESTKWVTNFSVYLAIIAMCLFLIIGYKYQTNPKLFLKTCLFFIVAFFVLPIRTQALPIIAFIQQIYFRKINLALTLLCISFVSVFIMLHVPSMHESESRLVLPKFILIAFLTGHPPILASLTYFLGNLFIPLYPIYYDTHLGDFLSKQEILFITVTILILGNLLLTTIYLLKKKYKLSLIPFIGATYSLSIYLARPQLIGWQPHMIATAEIGGTFYIFLILIFIISYKTNRLLSEIGLLGVLISLISLIPAWLTSPVFAMSETHQSAFLPYHRYYTFPLTGSAMMLASFTALLACRRSRLIKVIVFMILVNIIIYNSILTHKTLLFLSKPITELCRNQFGI